MVCEPYAVGDFTKRPRMGNELGLGAINSGRYKVWMQYTISVGLPLQTTLCVLPTLHVAYCHEPGRDLARVGLL